MADNGNHMDVLGPRIPPRRMSDPEKTEFAAAARRRTARLVGAGAIALALGLVVVAIVGRDPIMALWPTTARVYRSFNLVEAPGTGLKITLTVSRAAGGVVVAGDIVNDARESRDLPRLRVNLHDSHRTNLDAKLIDPPVARLAAGATAHFETVFDHPNMAATGASAIFATER